MTLLNKKTICDALLIVVLLGLITCKASAEDLRDPTQISLEHFDNNSMKHTEHTAPIAPKLQSIMLGSDAHVAIISGKKIKVGQQYNNARLVSLTENTATLRKANGETLVLEMNYNSMKKQTSTFNELSNDALDVLKEAIVSK